jgi:hypothetical protein
MPLQRSQEVIDSIRCRCKLLVACDGCIVSLEQIEQHRFALLVRRAREVAHRSRAKRER